MSHLAVQPSLLVWAQERSGVPADTLRGKFDHYDDCLRGTKRPTMKQLENFAAATRTPLGYFFLSAPPVERLPIPDFRTLMDKPPARPSPELLDTIGMLQRRQEWLREFLIEEGADPLPFVASISDGTPPEEAAARMREFLGIGTMWAAGEATWEDALRLLRRKIQEAGIHVVINGVVGNNSHRKLSVAEFRGFALCDKYAPFIFVNGTDAKAAQMFTLAHELAHLARGNGGVFAIDAARQPSSPVERFCNETAAEFLVPQKELRAAWEKAKGAETPFESLSAKFKVSPIVTARRARDAGLVTPSQFFSYYNGYMDDWRHREARRRARGGGGDFWQNQSLRIGDGFGAAVVRAARSGKLLYRDAYRLTGFSGETFDRYAKTINPRLL